jgi:uncharacterized oxidoreductase
MDLKQRTALITGGSSGIGHRIAEELLARDCTVIVCGRREDRLELVRRQHPGLIIRVCDVSNREDRQALRDWAVSSYPRLSLLVNNAGIQRRIDLAAGARDLAQAEEEIAINFTGTVALAALFAGHLAAQPEAAILNISSGLAFVPIAAMPVYCATKAAVHSFTLSLRYQLARTNVKVFEGIPPTTDTDLDQGRRPPQARGIPAAEVARAIVAGVERGQEEIPVGEAAGLMDDSRRDPEASFRRLNRFS